MFDLGWGELLLIGIVALIVVGPKDLPRLFRELGKFTGKARAMARDFSRAMNAAADEAGVKDIDRTLRAATNPMRTATNSMRDTVRDAVNLKDTDSKGAKAATGTKSAAKPAATDAPPPDEAAADAGIVDEVVADEGTAAASVSEEVAAPPKPAPKAAPKKRAPKTAADPSPVVADSADGTST